MNICEKCSMPHDGTYSTGRFCSKKCAKAFATFKNRQEINKKVKIKFAKKRKLNEITIKCEWCSFDFKAQINDKKKKRFCCVSCSMHSRMSDPSKRLYLQNCVKERMKNGTFIGWKSRKNKEMSFAEKIVASILDEEKIKYEFDFPVNRWFIDFAFQEQKVALEIDGKQHLDEERIKKDKEKDEFLTKEGWKVFRIPWKRPYKGIRDDLRKQLLELIRV